MLSALLFAILCGACSKTGALATTRMGARPAETSLLDTARLRASFDFPACTGPGLELTPNVAHDTVDVEACGKHVRYRCPERMELHPHRLTPRDVYRVCEIDVRADDAPCPETS